MMSWNLEQHCSYNQRVLFRRSVFVGKYCSVSHLCAVDSTKGYEHLKVQLNSYVL